MTLPRDYIVKAQEDWKFDTTNFWIMSALFKATQHIVLDLQAQDYGRLWFNISSSILNQGEPCSLKDCWCIFLQSEHGDRYLSPFFFALFLHFPLHWYNAMVKHDEGRPWQTKLESVSERWRFKQKGIKEICHITEKLDQST